MKRTVTSNFKTWESEVEVGEEDEIRHLYSAISNRRTAGSFLSVVRLDKTYVMRLEGGIVLSLNERSRGAYQKSLERLIRILESDEYADYQEWFEGLTLTEKVKHILNSKD